MVGMLCGVWDLLLHTKVGWLSQGKIQKHFLSLLGEIKAFMEMREDITKYVFIIPLFSFDSIVLILLCEIHYKDINTDIQNVLIRVVWQPEDE